jgi:hypothetical protein
VRAIWRSFRTSKDTRRSAARPGGRLVDDAPRTGRWGLLLAALVAFLLVPGTPLVQSVAPVADTAVLFLPALAVCTILGWGAGGPMWLALVWSALALGTVLLLPGRQPAFSALERGWSLILAGGFGVICAASTTAIRFFPRALAGLAMSVALTGALAVATPGAPRLLERAARAEVRSRPNAALAWVRGTSRSPDWQALKSYAGGGTSMETAAQTADAVLASVPEDAVPVFPALLGLESLAALAIAWSLYHRISRARIGEPLGRLHDFRFNDQLVWGLIVGVVLVMMPTFVPWRGVGINLLVFFGALYAVRGLGVLVWFLERKHASAPAVLALAVAASVLSAPAALGLALLGLADTWLDWRRRDGRATPRGAT